MDSGNSCSLQSSSSGDGGGGEGGDVNLSTHFNPVPILHPSGNFFDPSSFSQPVNPNPSSHSMHNSDFLWSGNSNLDPIYSFGSHQDPYRNPNPVDDHINHEKLGVTMKNPRKRTRASRRAHTTVLTTNTTNFRRMVQEFTGIPAVPFSGSTSSSAFSRRNVYGGGITPMNPLRPSPQKIQLQQPSYVNSATATTSNFRSPPSETHVFAKQPLNLSNLHNQMFPFQSLSQTTVRQQVNASERENQRSEPPSALTDTLSTSVKRWMGQDENLMSFEGLSGSSQNVIASTRNTGDQLLGDEDSWSF